MRSQTNEWAAGFSPEISASRLLKGFSTTESSTPGALQASRRRTGGVIDCGTVEEDGTVTWEAPDVLRADTG